MSISKTFVAAAATLMMTSPSMAQDLPPTAAQTGLHLSPAEIAEGVSIDLHDIAAIKKIMFVGCNPQGFTFAMPLMVNFYLLEGAAVDLTADERRFHLYTLQQRAMGRLQVLANDPLQIQNFSFTDVEGDYLKALRDETVSYYRETGLTYFFEPYRPMVLLPGCLTPTQITAAVYNDGVTLRAQMDQGIMPQGIPGILAGGQILTPKPAPI